MLRNYGKWPMSGLQTFWLKFFLGIPGDKEIWADERHLALPEQLGLLPTADFSLLILDHLI